MYRRIREEQMRVKKYIPTVSIKPNISDGGKII